MCFNTPLFALSFFAVHPTFSTVHPTSWGAEERVGQGIGLGIGLGDQTWGFDEGQTTRSDCGDQNGGRIGGWTGGRTGGVGMEGPDEGSDWRDQIGGIRLEGSN